MQKKYLVISSSLNPGSNSRLLAKAATESLSKKADAELLDLRDYPLPLCDGGEAYGDANVRILSEKIKNADGILVAVPIYNWDVSAAAKNLVELTGKAWENKTVGFLCAAGGKFSYMSVMSFANSLMLDFRCLIVPRFVYADGSQFSAEEISDPQVA